MNSDVLLYLWPHVQHAQLVLGHHVPDRFHGRPEKVVVVLANVKELVVLETLQHPLLGNEPTGLPVDLVVAHGTACH